MLIQNIQFYLPDIHAIPQYNYQKFQKYVLLDAGLGSSVADIATRVSNIHTYIANDRKEDALIESNNLTLGVFSALEGLSYTSMALACMVQRVDGRKPDIATDDSVRELSNRISMQVSGDKADEYLNDLKKKLILN